MEYIGETLKEFRKVITEYKNVVKRRGSLSALFQHSNSICNEIDWESSVVLGKYSPIVTSATL